MEESVEYIHTEENRIDTKWLRVLFCVRLVRLLLMCEDTFLNIVVINGWLSEAADGVLIVALFCLAGGSRRYRTAGILAAVAVIGGLVIAWLGLESLSIVFAIMYLAAHYFEYKGHSELAQTVDQQLSEQWNSLFYWEFSLGLVIGVLTTIGSVIFAIAGFETAAVVMGVNVVNVGVEALISGLYMKYLKKSRELLA